MNRTRLAALISGSAVLLTGAAVALQMSSAPEARQYTFRDDLAQGRFAGYNEYLHMLRANQVTGEIDPAAVEAAWAQLLQTAQKTNTLNWESRGPDNHGGRTRAMLVDRNNSNIVYAGSVGGGLYRSTNGGASWNVVSDPGANQAVGSICQAANGDIYYGTGEIWLGYGGTGQNTTPNFAGRGVYKSTDGVNFVQIASTLPANNSASAAWTSVADIEAHPTDANTIFAATNGGFMKTTDGGATWTQLLSGNITDFAISATGTLYVAQAGRTMKSTDGSTFTEVSSAIVTSTSLPRRAGGRIRYSVSPQDDNYVYCVQTNGSALAAVYRSTNGGSTWSMIGQKGANFDPLCNGVGADRYCQGIFDLLLTVSAKDKDFVWLGGITLWQWSATGGWVQASTLNDFAGNPFYLHADSHELIVDPSNPDVVFASNDGGVFKSTNHGSTWF
ncbi:MAG: WD40/YVTN/BNR-like repeat-containing protein, partial [Schleiferiaceae bacterium]